MQRLHTPMQAAQWLKAQSVVELNANSTYLTASALQTDSRCVKNGDVFMAWPGQSFDARHYISKCWTMVPKGVWCMKMWRCPRRTKLRLTSTVPGWMTPGWLSTPI